MSRRSYVLICLCFALGCDASRASAQSAEFGARTLVRRPIVATHGEDPTAAGTSIDVSTRVASVRSLGLVVRESPGTLVQSSGGLGAYASLGLRGADAMETLVLLDEIPLMTPDGGPFDLSAFPAELFGRVDVFRGGAPVWLGSGAIGGVLRLVPRPSDQVGYDVSAGAGSFGSWQLQLGESAGTDKALHVQARALLRGSNNDYPYFDDKGTRFDSRDDDEQRRKNAQLTDASGYLDLTAPWLGGRLHALVLTNARTGGEPGPGSQPTPNIHRQRLRGLAGVAYERSWRESHRLQLVAASSYAHDRYTDLFGELGTSQRWDTNDAAYRAFVRAADTLQLARWLTATFVGSYALDAYLWENRFRFPAPAPSTRHDLAAALEFALHGRLAGMPFELRPSARVEWSDTTVHADRGLRGTFDGQRQVTAPTARLGAALTPAPGIAVSASAATGVRLPTLFELFGDRGNVLPAPDLRAVRSTTYDVGLTLQRARTWGSAQVELRGFLQERKHEIGAVRTAQYQVAHQNLSEVEQRGVELGVRGSLWDVLGLHGAATYLSTSDALAKRLPLRPSWNVFARPEARWSFARGLASSAEFAAEVSYRSFVFADRANLATIPACSTLALSASLGFLRDRLRLLGRMEDVTDARCVDLIGYPLPGRSLFFTITYQEMTHDHA